jgi:cytochrome P450
MARRAKEADNPLTWANSDFSRAPQDTYAAIRTASPALKVDGVGVLVSSRELVDQVLRDPATYSSAFATGHLKNNRPLIPLEIDPPDQRKFRKLLDPLFAPRRMQALEPAMRSLVNDLIDAFADNDVIDFVAQFSIPFPSQVFLTMLGLPLDDLSQLLALKDGIIRPHIVVGEELGNQSVEAHQAATARSIYDYFSGVLDERATSRRDDLVSYFLDADVDGERLSRTDILDICFLLLVAGLDTVSASLDCLFVHLAEHPQRRRELADDPSLIPAAVEELLRWETPVMLVPRVATCPVQLAGTDLDAGDRVMVMLGAANLDPTDVNDPTEVRWDRDDNRHLAFGGGVHRCLGSHLARTELRVALEVWHQRIPNYRIEPGATLEFANGVRALDRFPMILDRP